MESKARATVADAFVVIMVLMVIATVLWFSNDKTVRIQYDIVTSYSVNGVSSQASVELYGINVGLVESVSFMGAGKVRIRMLIDEQAPINQATFATLNSRGVTGSVFVDLKDDTDIPAELHDKLLYGPDTTGIPQIPLRQGVLESFAESAVKVFSRVDGTLESLEAWLSPENEQKLFTTVENFGQAANNITKLSATLDTKASAVLDEFTGVMRGANSALTDIRGVLGHANKLLLDLKKPDGALQSITQGAQTLANAADHLNYVTLPQVDHAAQGIASTLETAKTILQKLENQPQMLLWGPGKVQAGPGEPGYESPYSRGGRQ